MSKAINVGIDLDGVCANFAIMYSAIANKIFGERCYIVKDDSLIKHWDWYKWYPITKEEDGLIWQYIAKSENFWTALPVLDKDNFIYSTRQLQSLKNVNVYFITARVGTKGMTVAKQSIMWLKQHGWSEPQVFETKFKGDFARILELDYFIDDKTENVIDVKASYPGCEVFVYSTPYNQDVEKKINGVIRIKNLREFTDDILKKCKSA